MLHVACNCYSRTEYFSANECFKKHLELIWGIKMTVSESVIVVINNSGKASN